MEGQLLYMQVIFEKQHNITFLNFTLYLSSAEGGQARLKCVKLILVEQFRLE